MTTVPLKTKELLDYVNGWRPDGIDLSASQLTPAHVWNYLSFLKVEDRVMNVTPSQLTAYLTTRDYVRVAGMTDYVRDVLYFKVVGERYFEQCDWSDATLIEFATKNADLLDEMLSVLRALPALLHVAKGLERQNASAECVVGVNFVCVFSDPMFLITLLPDCLACDVSSLPYYEPLFTDYIYGGDNLIWHVNANLDNLLFQALL